MANYVVKLIYDHPIDGATTITMDLPPSDDPLKERKRTTGKETRSSSGKGQYQLNYTDQFFNITLVFLTKALKDELEKLFDDYASFGRSFQYFPSSDEVEFFDVVWSGARKSFDPKRVIADGDDFIYDLSIPIRVNL